MYFLTLVSLQLNATLELPVSGIDRHVLLGSNLWYILNINDKYSLWIPGCIRITSLFLNFDLQIEIYKKC